MHIITSCVTFSDPLLPYIWYDLEQYIDDILRLRGNSALHVGKCNSHFIYISIRRAYSVLLLPFASITCCHLGCHMSEDIYIYINIYIRKVPWKYALI